MKKPILLTAAIAAATLLASCGDGSTCSSCPAGSEGTATAQPTTFAEQLKAAGIDFTYEDPNAAIYEAETKPADEDIDCIAGASGTGTDYYPAGTGSYYTFEYMVERANTKYYGYYWENIENWKPSQYNPNAEAPASAATLEAAAALEGAEHMTEVFPNDGESYYVASYSNAIATKTIVTTDADGVISTAVYGMGAKMEGDTAYFTGSITNKTTLHNLIEIGEGMIIMYEYNPTSNDKTGPGNRNFGCRVTFEVDWEKSIFTSADGSGTIKVTPGTVPENLGYGSVQLKCTALYTLG